MLRESKLNRHNRGQAGSALLLFALMLPVLLGFVGLAVDFGVEVGARRKAQNAADAAALAGVVNLPSSSSTACSNAQSYLATNGPYTLMTSCPVGAPSTPCPPTSSGPTSITICQTYTAGDTILVTISQSVTLSFLKVLGFSSGTVLATAGAVEAGIVGCNTFDSTTNPNSSCYPFTVWNPGPPPYYASTAPLPNGGADAPASGKPPLYLCDTSRAANPAFVADSTVPVAPATTAATTVTFFEGGWVTDDQLDQGTGWPLNNGFLQPEADNNGKNGCGNPNPPPGGDNGFGPAFDIPANDFRGFIRFPASPPPIVLNDWTTILHGGNADCSGIAFNTGQQIVLPEVAAGEAHGNGNPAIYIIGFVQVQITSPGSCNSAANSPMKGQVISLTPGPFAGQILGPCDKVSNPLQVCISKLTQ